MALSKEISLSVAIMAHPKREEQVGDLIQRLDCDVPAVVWDRKGDRWDTGRRAMLSYDIDCTHHAVLQDDTLICRDLIAGLKKVLTYVPANAPLCGYVGRLRPQIDKVAKTVEKANQTRASFITMHTLNWGPLIVVPTDSILEMIGHCDKLREVLNYDRRLSRYWELKRNIRVWYTWPNLVDHADGPSLVSGRIGTNRAERQRTRVAHNFLGESKSALAVNWSGPVVHLKSDGTVIGPPAPKASPRAATWQGQER